jgi:hypothetical protein
VLCELLCEPLCSQKKNAEIWVNFKKDHSYCLETVVAVRDDHAFTFAHEANRIIRPELFPLPGQR